MSVIKRNLNSLFFIIIFFIYLTSCASNAAVLVTTSTDPQLYPQYVLVTADPKATNTPFQPEKPTELVFLTQTSSPTAALPVLIDTPIVSVTPSPNPTLVIVESVTPFATEVPTILPVDTSTPLPHPDMVDLPTYSMSVLMDYPGHVVTVNETIIYPNISPDQLASIALAVNPNLWSGVFSLQTLEVNGQTANNYNLGGQWLTVSLDTPLLPGNAIKIGITYQLTLPFSSAKFENFGYTSRQTNLIDWYPYVPPYQNGQWVLPDPYMYGENLVYDKANFQVTLTFSEPANAPVVAASSTAINDNGSLVYNLSNARNFTISASPDYLISTADANGVTIFNYYFPSNSNAAAMVLELTRMSVNTYSTEFGPYPHNSLTVCETDLNDGLETDGLYFLASSFYQSFDGSVKNSLSTIAIHETAHQWWYGAVGNNQAVEPWLDEALATYSEHVFYEDNYPDLINWWWNFRVDSHAPSGWVDSRVYDTGSFRAYVNAVYFNGAHFLQALRDRIGDQAYFDFLRDYYTRNNGRIASSYDFFAILDLHSSTDISDIISTYFYYR